MASSGSCRTATPPHGFWYDQPQHEWVVLLTGAATTRFEDAAIEMRPGDHITIPAHTRHRVEWTVTDGPTVRLAVHNENVRHSHAP